MLTHLGRGKSWGLVDPYVITKWQLQIQSWVSCQPESGWPETNFDFQSISLSIYIWDHNVCHLWICVCDRDCCQPLLIVFCLFCIGSDDVAHGVSVAATYDSGRWLLISHTHHSHETPHVLILVGEFWPATAVIISTSSTWNNTCLMSWSMIWWYSR